MFPTWMYHPKHGARLFETPEQLERAGNGWEDSPETVGLSMEAPADLGHMLTIPSPEQPTDPNEDESVATEEEAALSAAKAAKNARRASVPTTPSGRARALRGK